MIIKWRPPVENRLKQGESETPYLLSSLLLPACTLPHIAIVIVYSAEFREEEECKMGSKPEMDNILWRHSTSIVNLNCFYCSFDNKTIFQGTLVNWKG